METTNLYLTDVQRNRYSTQIGTIYFRSKLVEKI